MQIYPNIEQNFFCPICNQETTVKKNVWQGIHVGVKSRCKKCQKEYYQDLNVGHSTYTPYSVDLDTFQLFGSDSSIDWYGTPLQKSLQNPNRNKISFEKEVFEKKDEVIILNCIDYLYGHSLLKLLNAERHLQSKNQHGLIVIVPKFLEWMLPEGIAEKWVFDISLKEGQDFFIDFDNVINKELERFSKIYISKAFSHPKNFDITNFTGVKKHNFKDEKFRITFIWREDRLWINNSLLQKSVNKFNIKIIRYLLLAKQKRKLLKVFLRLREVFPNAEYTVAGFGKYNNFPKWIDNQIVNVFNENIERKLCQIYSESRLILGVHGSNMLLPSAHAGMTVDLMPEDRWGNFAQDILYQEKDVRMSSYRYRYIPINQKPTFIHNMISHMIKDKEHFVENMIID